MDPKACLRRYVIACCDNDADEAEAAANDYNAWISRGGFPAQLVLADGIALPLTDADYERGVVVS